MRTGDVSKILKSKLVRTLTKLGTFGSLCFRRTWMNSYYDFTYYPNSTSSDYTTSSWATKNASPISFRVPVEDFVSFTDPVVNLGYKENSDPDNEVKHLWFHENLELDIFVGYNKIRYSVYKGDRVSSCEFARRDFELLSKEEISRRIVTCELEVSNG